MATEDKHLYSNFDYESALSVQQGVKQPEQVNNSYLEKVRSFKRKEVTVEEMVSGILGGDRSMLSRAITLLRQVCAIGNYRRSRCREKYNN